MDAYHQQQSIFTRAAHFILHLAEMCFVMCVSFAIFTQLSVWGGSLIGYSNPPRQFPVLSVMMLSIYLTPIITAWMRLRRREWHITLEMASTPLLAVIPLVGASWLGIRPQSSLLEMECGLACIFMVVVMLFRLDYYTTSHASHQQPLQATSLDAS